jgi:glycosyltransferase involved in cell wall biosynthesis
VDLVIGAAGRLSPEKGFDVLVAAAANIAKNNPSAGFVLFGDGPLQETLERQIMADGLVDRFILAGFRPDLDRFLPNLDMLVQSSLTEGLPNVLLEACAAGIPVVATAVGGTPEIIEDGLNGSLVPPGEPAALAERISALLSSAQARSRMGAAGRQLVQRQFTFEAQSRLYGELFQDLVQARNRRLAAKSMSASAKV